MDSSVNNQQARADQGQGRQSPLVSIIMPVYNGEGLVRRAMASVAKQSFADYELIVIDDGSTDGTAGVVKPIAASAAKVIYERNEKNLGIQDSLNKGLEMARGKYIARIDCDDQWVGGDKLEQQVRFLEENKDHVLVGTGAIVVNESDEEMFRFLEPLKDEAIRRMILSKNCFLHSSVLMRKEAVMEAGGYDAGEDCKHVEDYDLWLRLGKIGKLANLPVYGLRYAVSSTQISSQHRIAQFRKNIYLMRKYWDDYPGHVMAWIRNYTRLIVYGYLRLDWLKKLTSKIYAKKYSE